MVGLSAGDEIVGKSRRKKSSAVKDSNGVGCFYEASQQL